MDADPRVTGIEAALFGELRVSEVDAWIGGVVGQLTGAGVAEVLFRSGRIDAVYGLRATDDRRLLVKVHRPPVDLAVRRATSDAQRTLAAAGFPCAVPVGDPTDIDGRVVSIETLLDGGLPADGHDPGVRDEIAATLAEQMGILGAPADLIAAGRHAPAWCRYQDGPWPTPHDSYFDFRVTPDDWGWLDELARRSSTQTLEARDPAEQTAVSHADWYCGNLRFDGPRLAACFDWDLVTDTVSVLAGLTAGFHTHGTTAGAQQADPGEVLSFLTHFERAYGTRFDADQQRAAAGSATWSICYAARCQVQMLDGDPEAGSPLDALRRFGDEYLALRW